MHILTLYFTINSVILFKDPNPGLIDFSGFIVKWTQVFDVVRMIGMVHPAENQECFYSICVVSDEP